MSILDSALLRVVGVFSVEMVIFYWRLGLTWSWDRFDLAILAAAGVAAIPCLWRDVRNLHTALVIAPQERRWSRERAARRARRAAAQDYLRNRRDR